MVTNWTYAQQDSLNFVISNRVNFEEDTTRKEILNLYKNYFNSRPDSLYDNPYWNKKEKEKYVIYDFSQPGIFNGINFNILKNYFDFYVLSIEKIGKESYSLRAMIISKMGLKNQGSSVWCIHKVSAIKEDNEWRLQNNLVQETAQWNSFYTNKINYHFKDTLNYTLATKAGHFVDSLRTIFNINNTDTLDYYITKNADELGLLRGFDYFFTGYTTGITGSNYIMSSKRVFYAHELVHFALKTPEVKSNFMVTEGFAEFLGTKKQNPKRYYNSLNQLLKDILSQNYSIANLLAQDVKYNGYNYRYPFGALLCELVYEQKGIEGLKNLLFSNTKEEEHLKKALSKALSIAPNQLEQVIFDFAKSKEQSYRGN